MLLLSIQADFKLCHHGLVACGAITGRADWRKIDRFQSENSQILYMTKDAIKMAVLVNIDGHRFGSNILFRP